MFFSLQNKYRKIYFLSFLSDYKAGLYSWNVMRPGERMWPCLGIFYALCIISCLLHIWEWTHLSVSWIVVPKFSSFFFLNLCSTSSSSAFCPYRFSVCLMSFKSLLTLIVVWGYPSVYAGSHSNSGVHSREYICFAIGSWISY